MRDDAIPTSMLGTIEGRIGVLEQCVQIRILFLFAAADPKTGLHGNGPVFKHTWL